MFEKKLFWFRQNNSGGFYTGPAYNIIVEADDENDAWLEARYLGLTNEGSCNCCGPRWYFVQEYKGQAIESDDYDDTQPLVIGCPPDRKWKVRVSTSLVDYEVRIDENIRKKALDCVGLSGRIRE